MKLLLEMIGLALATLRENKTRSVLTVLGVVIGTGTIIAIPSSLASDRMRLTVGPSGTASVLSYHFTDCSAQK